jgi:hypothetical protein|tara:strand:+ start:1033 stop:1992 length:960 start_codon:yes stop_codon:yes gene_type:complete
MVGGPHTKLANLRNAQDSTLSNTLLDNFIAMYDWGLLDRGQFYNINIPESGIYGGDRHKLRTAQDPNYTDGQVWEGYRQNWVWESGISATDEQPITISGVFVDDTFYATGNVTKPFYIDHPNGRVVFDTALTTTSAVQLEYSHKWVQVIPAQGVPWFRQIQQGSFRNEEGFQVSNSGNWVQLGQTRVQLPAIAIEVVPAKSLQPYQLGGGQWVNTDLVFYIMSENHWECTNLMDAILYQNDRSVHLFDPTAVAISGVLPFNYRNELNENAIPSGLYPNMVDNFFYRRCWINESRGNEVSQLSPELYIGTTRCSTQVKAI